MEVMRFADKADGGRLGIQDSRQHVVVRGRPTCAFGHAEGGEGRTGLRPRFKERAVGRVCAGPAAFDVVKPERVKRLGDLRLLVGGELDALGLLAVAQRGVEKKEPFSGHFRASSLAGSSLIFDARLASGPRSVARTEIPISSRLFFRSSAAA